MKLGRYMHHKGKEYEVIGTARDSETLEEVVVYKALYSSPDFGERALWIRKKANFEELIDNDGQSFPRFKYIGDIEQL